MPIQLVKPHPRYETSFLEALEETERLEPERIYMFVKQHEETAKVRADFPAYVKKILCFSRGQNLPPGYVPSSIFWLVDGQEFIGQTSIRHTLNDFLFSFGGHIGYFIRPTRRFQGYGSIILSLALEEAKKLGINPVLVTCDADNAGSKKIIEKNGSIFENALRQENLPEKLRYWFHI